MGSATNEIYRKDGRRVEMHPTEDRLFHFSVEEFGVSLYGVVDGFGGAGVADFGAKKMPAELLLGQVGIIRLYIANEVIVACSFE